MSEQPLFIAGLTIDKVIQNHLQECDQCRETAAKDGPARLGDHSGHCGTYWHFQLMRAKHEGAVNNIVAHTELGDEAEIRGRLE